MSWCKAALRLRWLFLVQAQTLSADARQEFLLSPAGRPAQDDAFQRDLIRSFESDIVIMDYRVRGFTRDISGQKHYIDHEITSIQNYIADVTADRYQMIDVNVYQEKIFHTKMILKDFNLDNYLFETDKDALADEERQSIQKRLKQEMAEIFYGRNYKLRR